METDEDQPVPDEGNSTDDEDQPVSDEGNSTDEDQLVTDEGNSTDEDQPVPDEVNFYPALQYPPLPPKNCGLWDYAARRTCQEIIPGLYLGPYASVTRAAKDKMLEMKLTHVVCVRSAAEVAFVRPNHQENFRYLVVEVNDSLFESIIPKVKLVNGFVDECLKAGGRVLVHGNAGVNRSAAIVIGYLMWAHGVDAKTAFSFVQAKRLIVEVNDAFMSQLGDYEMMVKAMHSVPQNGQDNPNKRCLGDDEDDPVMKHDIEPPTEMEL